MDTHRSRRTKEALGFLTLSVLIFAFQNCGGFAVAPLHAVNAGSQADPNAGNSAKLPNATKITLPAPASTPTTNWIGNSFGKQPQVMQIDVEALFVRKDGTLYTNAYWSESGTQAGVYKNGASLAFMNGMQGYGRSGGYAVTADVNFIYVTMTQSGCDGGNDSLNANGLRQYPPCGTIWTVVRRFDQLGRSAPFASGLGYDGAMALVASTTSTDTRQLQSNIPKGLVVRNNQLYVSDPSTNQVLIYDLATLEKIGAFTANMPGAMALDAADNLWIVQSNGRVNRYSGNGVPSSVGVSVSAPVGVAVDSKNQLLIADGGLDQNIKIYDSIDANPTLKGTFGERGGTEAGLTPGALGPLRFNGLTGVGADSTGNIYISQNGKGVDRDAGFNFNVELRSFNGAGGLNWNLFSNEYVNGGVFDPQSDGKSVYTTFMHYDMTKPGSNGQPGSADGITFARFTNPDDPRNHLGRGFLHPIAFRWINGKKFLFMNSMFPAGLFIYRFEGEIAVPSGIISTGTVGDTFGNLWPANQPSGGAWIWRDSDGDKSFESNEYEAGDVKGNNQYGWWIDLNGNVWQTTIDGIRKYSVQGLDAVGNPVYSQAQSRLFAFPSGFASVTRVIHDSETDTVYLSGFQNGDSDDGCYGSVGKALSRIDNFSSKPAVAWTTRLPFECSTRKAPKAMDWAGNAIFVAETADGGYGGGLIRVFDVQTGKETVNFSPGAAVGNSTGVGWTDIPYALQAFEKANGQYILLNEDDLYGKIVTYTW